MKLSQAQISMDEKLTEHVFVDLSDNRRSGRWPAEVSDSREVFGEEQEHYIFVLIEAVWLHDQLGETLFCDPSPGRIELAKILVQKFGEGFAVQGLLG